MKKMCVCFLCGQIISINLFFSASESAPERHVAMYCNNTHNRRPFFCVFREFNSLNDKIYIKANKTREKYLRIAYLTIVRYCCVSYHGVPPLTRSLQRSLPLLKIFYFLFFYFFSIGVYIVFP